MENNNAFLGQGWGFPPQFFAGGAAVEMVAGEEDIKQSLGILLSTALKERVMFPAYGCDLSHYQFAEIGQQLINSLSATVSDAILLNEPRIVVDEVNVVQDNDELGLLLISIEYVIASTNNRYNMVYPFYINEASK
jgi:phage baseplate assembly protein W